MLTFGLDDLKSLFQPRWFYDSMILGTALHHLHVKGVLLPHSSALWRPHLERSLPSWTFQYRGVWTYWRELSKGPRRCWSVWSMLTMWWGWERWQYLPWRREGSEASYTCVEIPDGGQWGSQSQKRGNRYEVKHRRFCLNAKKHCESDQALNRLPWKQGRQVWIYPWRY